MNEQEHTDAIKKAGFDEGVIEGARQIVGLLTEKLIGGYYGKSADGIALAVLEIRFRYLPSENPYPESSPSWHVRAEVNQFRFQ